MHAFWNEAVFYIFAALAVISAVLVVMQSNPVRCVLSLVVTFFASSVLWLLQDAEFLSLILVLVYVGAVMTLFLFVVMMLNVDIEMGKTRFSKYLPLGFILVALILGLLVLAVPGNLFKPLQTAPSAAQLLNPAPVSTISRQASSKAPKALKMSNTAQIGEVLYTDYVLAFEMAAALLLVAIVASITLTHRAAARSKSKQQDILKQLMTRRDERVSLVNIQPEK